MGGLQIADEARAKADGPGLKNKLGAMLRTGLEKLRLFMPRAHHMFPSRKGETNMAESYVKKQFVLGWWRGETGSVMEPIVYDGEPRNGVNLAFLDEENDQPKLTLTGQHPEKLSFAWTKFRGPGHLLCRNSPGSSSAGYRCR